MTLTGSYPRSTSSRLYGAATLVVDLDEAFDKEQHLVSSSTEC